jgi:hypothetical protein
MPGNVGATPYTPAMLNIGESRHPTLGFLSLRNPHPLFVCDACGWRKVAHSRFKLGQVEPGVEPRFAVEILGETYHPDYVWMLNRRLGRKWFIVSAITKYCETRLEAEEYGRQRHNIKYPIHYRILENENYTS